MNIHNIYSIFWKYFRVRRLAKFVEMFPEDQCKTIIDLGGSTYQWDNIGYKSKITILNLTKPACVDGLPNNYEFIDCDARNTPFPNQSFDLAFSNSVIEHVGGKDEQKQFACEMLRIGKHIYCQTPNKSFFIEPHLIAPFIHWLPKKWQSYHLIRYFTVWGLITKPSREKAEEFLTSIRLLNKKDLIELFPGCKVITERFFLMPKSYTVIK